MKSNHSTNFRLLIIDDNDQEAAYVKSGWENADGTLEESAKQNATEEERHRKIMRMFSGSDSAD